MDKAGKRLMHINGKWNSHVDATKCDETGAALSSEEPNRLWTVCTDDFCIQAVTSEMASPIAWKWPAHLRPVTVGNRCCSVLRNQKPTSTTSHHLRRSSTGRQGNLTTSAHPVACFICVCSVSLEARHDYLGNQPGPILYCINKFVCREQLDH